jgi:hypothetical protein
MPVGTSGDSTAVLTPALDAVSESDAFFHFIPRQTPAQLQFELYVGEAPATPSGMAAVLEQMIAAGNYKYRTAVLEFPIGLKLVFPDSARFVPRQAKPVLEPANIFPLAVGYDVGGVSLVANTAVGSGSVKRVDFDEGNVFGFAEHYKTWNDKTGRNEQTVISTLPENGLGVRGQQCQVSRLTHDRSVNTCVMLLFRVADKQ